MSALESRPSIRLYMRERGTGWTGVVLNNRDGGYGYGYEAGCRDVAATLPAMSPSELSSVWPAAYTEGYLDAYADRS